MTDLPPIPSTNPPGLGLFEAIYTARSLRHFKPDPVPQELIEKVIDAAIRVSSGGNTQHWTFIVVRDSAKKRELGALYRKASDYAEKIYSNRPTPAHLTDEQNQQFINNSAFLWDHMIDAPAILVPCLAKRDPPQIDTLPPVVQARYAEHLANIARTSGASIYPAVQNIILACRALGLGTVITTNHMIYEDEVKAALGIPANVGTFAMMPIGFPTKKYGPLTRKPVAEVTYADTWGTPWHPEEG